MGVSKVTKILSTLVAQQSISKAKTRAVKCGTVFLGHNQVEKKNSNVRVAQSGHLDFYLGYYITWRHTHFKYQALLLFSCNFEKLGGPGDEVRYFLVMEEIFTSISPIVRG